VIEVRYTAEARRWLDGLRDAASRDRIASRIDRLRRGLIGDAKPVGEGVSELRVHHGPGYRVYFLRRGEVLIVILCGGDKDSQARDIARAKALAAEWRS
jgi:putative addiction module killer protein